MWALMFSIPTEAPEGSNAATIFVCRASRLSPVLAAMPATAFSISVGNCFVAVKTLPRLMLNPNNLAVSISTELATSLVIRLLVAMVISIAPLIAPTRLSCFSLCRVKFLVDNPCFSKTLRSAAACAAFLARSSANLSAIFCFSSCSFCNFFMCALF